MFPCGFAADSLDPTALVGSKYLSGSLTGVKLSRFSGLPDLFVLEEGFQQFTRLLHKPHDL